jgi:hypothetical protein
MNHAGLTCDPAVSTVREVDYGLRVLKDALQMILARQKLNETEKQEQIRQFNYANAATLAGMHVGMLAAENMVRIEIQTLEMRRNAVMAYDGRIA